MLMTSDANLKQTLILKFVSNLFELVVRMDLFEANLVVLWHVKHLVLLLQWPICNLQTEFGKRSVTVVTYRL